jgi:hypothetical protein
MVLGDIVIVIGAILLLIILFIYARQIAIILILLILLPALIATDATGRPWVMAMFVLVFIYQIYLSTQQLIKNFTNYSPVNNSRLNNRSNNTRTSTANY